MKAHFPARGFQDDNQWSSFSQSEHTTYFTWKVWRVAAMSDPQLKQVWPKPSCEVQWKGEEAKGDRRRGGKTTSVNGQVCRAKQQSKGLVDSVENLFKKKPWCTFIDDQNYQLGSKEADYTGGQIVSLWGKRWCSLFSTEPAIESHSVTWIS